jgi:hypothetical protein
MQIGEPLRTIIVEPLELPVNDPATESDHEPLKAELDPEPASHRMTNRRKTKEVVFVR